MAEDIDEDVLVAVELGSDNFEREGMPAAVHKAETVPGESAADGRMVVQSSLDQYLTVRNEHLCLMHHTNSRCPSAPGGLALRLSLTASTHESPRGSRIKFQG